MIERPEIISLLGVPHYALPADGEDRLKLENELAETEEALRLNPDDPESHVMYGRRLAYLWRYHESIAVYSEALTRFGDHPGLYRHRGHRYISIRRFGPAAADLARADQLQPSDFDITYHLGLAHWLLGDWAGACRAYESFCMSGADSEERVAMRYWLYMALERTGRGRDAEAALALVGSPDVSENIHYLDLLQLFRGDKSEDEIRDLARESALASGTLGFGMGYWHLFNGRQSDAENCFSGVVSGKHWPAFGFIAAETELARSRGMLEC